MNFNEFCAKIYRNFYNPASFLSSASETKQMNMSGGIYIQSIFIHEPHLEPLDSSGEKVAGLTIIPRIMQNLSLKRL